MVSRLKVKGELLWGAFGAWPSIMWIVLSGPDAAFSRPRVMGVTLKLDCTKWSKVVLCSCD